MILQAVRKKAGEGGICSYIRLRRVEILEVYTESDCGRYTEPSTSNQNKDEGTKAPQPGELFQIILKATLAPVLLPVKQPINTL